MGGHSEIQAFLSIPCAFHVEGFPIDFDTFGGLCNHAGGLIYHLVVAFLHIPGRPVDRARTETETVMSNFQRLLESPFSWAAGVAGAFFRRSRIAGHARRERWLRREYLNG